MDGREIHGLQIAALSKVTKVCDDVWRVPSQSGPGLYTVMNGKTPHCTCPDHETTGQACKHIHAATFVIKREDNGDGTETVTKQVVVTEQVTRPTYGQDWKSYNAAQTHEREKFCDLLHSLCSGIPTTTEAKPGRPRIPLSDAIFCAAFKVFSTLSGRRFQSDLRDAKEKGYITKTPHFNSVFNVFDNADVTSILRDLIVKTSLPLKEVECDFAVDSSGFTTSRFHRWFDHKYGTVRQEHDWVKVHLMCGVKTHIVTAVEIKEKRANDVKVLPELVDTTAQNFQLREVSGDKAYGSRQNYAAIEKHGGTPFIAFKKSATGAVGGLWEKMHGYFTYRRDEFLAHYHKRSNVESTFSMIKAKFRDHVRSKTDTAMVNEVLCKILCHNICVLIQEMFELGIEPTFWKQESVA